MHSYANIFLIHNIERYQAFISGFNTDIKVNEFKFMVFYV